MLSTLADVAVNCRTSDQKVGETSVGQLFGTLAQGQQHSTAWQNITLDPIQLDSATRYHNVLLEMVETDAPWASGLQIAAFELVPSK